MGITALPPDGQAPSAESVQFIRAGLLRDFIYEALAPVEGDACAARRSLQNDDDIGARHHLKRVVACVRAAAKTFRELEALTAESVRHEA